MKKSNNYITAYFDDDDDLKTAVKDMVEAKMQSESSSDPMSNLNDL